MPPIQPLCVITGSKIKLHGRAGYFLPKGWTYSLAIANSPGRFRVMADGEQLGEWSSPLGLWSASQIPVAILAKTHTPTLLAVIPKRVQAQLVNLGAYRRVLIEFEQVPPMDCLTVGHCWVAPLNPKTKEMLFTSLYPPDMFAREYDRWKQQDPLRLPTIKVKGRGTDHRSAPHSTPQ